MTPELDLGLDLDRVDAAKLTRLMLGELKVGRGLRIGETTVMSRRLHTIRPSAPGEVRVNVAQDAGQVFYGRRRKNEVLHIDVFHEIGEVDHRRIAEVIKRAAFSYMRSSLMAQGGSGLFFPSSDELLDHIDVQTGTGGGRVSGTLNYGKKASLRKAHRNHVHIAAILPDNCISMVFYIVDGVEKEISLLGYEIRKVERIVNIEEAGEGVSDLSPYSSLFDSNISEHASSGSRGNWSMMNEAARLDAVSEIAEELGSREDLMRLMDALAQARYGLPSELGMEFGESEELIERLEKLDIIKRERGRFQFTEKGRDIQSLLKTHQAEIDAGIRRLLRQVPIGPAFHGEKLGNGIVKARSGGGRLGKETRRPAVGEWYDGIAVPETAIAFLKRAGFPRGEAGATGGARLSHDDIRVYKTKPLKPPEICLLLDASASMVGRRIRAAKHLIRHLSLASRARITALTFQERDVKMQISSTRSRRVVEEGLAVIRPAGLTPLASGIVETMSFLRARMKRTRDVLLVLITDGIPTMSKWSADPAKDALAAGREIAKAKVPFICIGLQPNKDYLRRLIQVTGGRLYIVDEFDKDILVQLIRHERPLGGL
ncbi:MAG: VWA domain-containing protein [Firmicutes bacterium]|nr:VWA domain-containing protein [Bacillota bacterium]